MKARLTFFVLFLLFLTGLNAQPGLPGSSVIPLKPQSPLFGKDIVINDSSSQNQRQVAICSAFNGWLYAVYTYFNTTYNCPAIKIFKSIDNGIIWTKINDIISNPVWPYTSMDMVVMGDSISNLKLFVSFVFALDEAGPGVGYVDRFNGITGNWEEILLQDNSCYRIALSTDFMYPATNSNPHSLGILYSAQNIFTNNQDSIIFCSSSNGGITLDNRQIISTITGNKFHKVALGYGRSPSYPTGRYFAVWEKQETINSTLGHIYTAHSNPNFNSPFTTPVQLDAMDPSALNMCRNPVIACQYNNADNDSANLTEVVLFEKYNPSNQKYDIRGYYNLQATNHSNFKKLTISNSAHNNFQPSINFNPFDSTFMVTFYDATTQKLPFLLNNFNLNNPDNWQVVTTGYNDDDNLSAPFPKVALNIGQKQGANVWANEGTGGNGIAMFDAPYSTYTGVSEINISTLARLIGAYPNPCSNEIKIAFELKKSGKVTINIQSVLGQPLGTVTDQYYPEGKHVVQYDVSDFPAGTYFYYFRLGDFTASGKFTVVR